MSIPLPPELVDAIVDHLSGHVRTLERCALVARTWSGPSQRALFHHIDLAYSLKVEDFLAHLTRHPHLQSLIRCVSLTEIPLETDDSDKADAAQYSICVAALLRCLPHLTSINVTYLPALKTPRFHQYFPKVVADFLCQSSLTAIEISGLYTQYNFQQALSSLEGSQIKRIRLITLGVQRPIQGFPEKAVCLPCIEFLRLDLPSRMFNTFRFWFSRPHTTFPGLKHCELSMSDLADMTVWLTWFRQSTLRLDCLRVEMETNGPVDGRPTDALSVFHDLHCTHLQLCIADRDRQPWSMMEWWINAFHSLVDSGTRIHFTELTFTFPNVNVGSSVWKALDGVLSHNAFRGVQKIHFEKNDERTLITDLIHPELASAIRTALPSLASRGVLRLL